MSAPLAIFALQSPVLLNIFAQSTQWELRVADLGDSGGLQETELLKAPRWDGLRANDVGHVFTCSPLQYETAKQQFPKAHVVWVLHTSRPDMLPLCKDRPVIAMSQRVASAASWAGASIALVVQPAYIADPIWSWVPNKTFTIKSRPKTRPAVESERVNRIVQQVGCAHTWYGQEQPGGFLNDVARRYELSACSCYASCLPTYAGFGLVEHEAFAAGVPVVSSRWGDSYRMPDDYCLSDNEEEQADYIRRCATDRISAERWSAQGLDYIRTYFTESEMDRGIERALELL